MEDHIIRVSSTLFMLLVYSMLFPFLMMFLISSLGFWCRLHMNLVINC